MVKNAISVGDRIECDWSIHGHECTLWVFTDVVRVERKTRVITRIVSVQDCVFCSRAGPLPFELGEILVFSAEFLELRGSKPNGAAIWLA